MVKHSGGRRRAPVPRPAGPAATPRTKPKATPWTSYNLVADLALALLVVGALVQLAGEASHARFYTDECFHAYASQWIASHRAIPRELPIFYGGFYYYYPPLLHLLGAASITAFGAGSLRYLNLALTALLLVILYAGTPAQYGRAPRRWAALLVLANGWFALHAVRFYVETLTTLLAVCVAVALLRLRASGRARDAVLLGVASGLSLLAKHTALVIPALLLVAAAVGLARGERRWAGGLALAVGIGLALALPMFARNQVLFGSPLYPVLARDLHRGLYALNAHTFSLPAAAFFRAALPAAGIPTLIVAAAALVLGVATRRGGLPIAIVGVALALALAAPLMPIHEVRHLNPVIGLIAFAGSLALAEGLGPRRAWRVTIDGALLAIAAIAVARMPDYRSPLDLPAPLAIAYEAIAREVPADETVLSLWTYDTAYYSNRRATWPIPWGQKEHPVEPFTERDPERFRAELARSEIGYVLVPARPQAREFNGANYPESFLDCASALVDRGEMVVVWKGEGLVLLKHTAKHASKTEAGGSSPPVGARPPH